MSSSLTSILDALDPQDEDDQQYLIQSWNDPAYTDVTVAIYRLGAAGGAGAAEDAGSRAAAAGGTQQPLLAEVPGIRDRLARWSTKFRSQIERWDVASVGGSRHVLRLEVEEEQLPAMQQLLEAIHTERLPQGVTEDPLQLCSLLQLAHFHGVPSVIKNAAAALIAKAPSLPADACAEIYVALEPLEGSAKLQAAVEACFERLKNQLSPLDQVFADRELGELFERLPAPTVQLLLKTAAETSQETVFLAALRWLDANRGGPATDSAVAQLLGRLDYRAIDSTLLAVAARSHDIFQGWRGALPALAAAALTGAANACVDGAHYSHLHAQLEQQQYPGFHGKPGSPQQPLVLRLEVPLPWLAQEAAALDVKTAMLRSMPQPTRQDINQLQPSLFSVYRGDAKVYRGYSWQPSLVLYLRVAPPFTFGELKPLEAGDFRLHADLQLEVQALPPLAPDASDSTASSKLVAALPGPLAKVEFATWTIGAAQFNFGQQQMVPKFEAEAGSTKQFVPLSAFGSPAPPPQPVPSTALWQPPCPRGGLSSPIKAFADSTFRPAPNALPHLTSYLSSNKMIFQVTATMQPC